MNTIFCLEPQYATILVGALIGLNYRTLPIICGDDGPSGGILM